MNTDRISSTTAAERQITSRARATISARSGTEPSFSRAPTSELASKTMFGIVRGKFRVDVLVGQAVRARIGLDASDQEGQRVRICIGGADEVADQLADAGALCLVREGLGGFRGNRYLNHHQIVHRSAPRSSASLYHTRY